MALSQTLTAEQLSDLAEIGNVGVGNAASCLSDLIHCRCLIGFPKVLQGDATTLKHHLGLDESYSISIHMGVMGGFCERGFLHRARNVYPREVIFHSAEHAAFDRSEFLLEIHGAIINGFGEWGYFVL